LVARSIGVRIDAETLMRHVSFACGLAIVFLLFGAAIAANFRSGHMPEMRGAWVAQALR
jgi:hypothetical protein